MSVCTRKANFTKFYGLVSPSRVSQATGEAFSLLPSPQRLEPEAASSFVSSLARRKIEVSSAATRCTRDSKRRRLIRRTSQPKRVPSPSLRGTFLRSRRSYRSSFARPSVCSLVSRSFVIICEELEARQNSSKFEKHPLFVARKQLKLKCRTRLDQSRRFWTTGVCFLIIQLVSFG